MLVTLRPVVEADLPVLFEHQREPEGNRMAAFPPRDREAFFAHWARVAEDRSAIVRAVIADGVLAGNVCSFVRFGDREIGYWIGREHWGRGIASAAVAQFLVDFPERPLMAHVAKHNAASLRVLAKCGFAAVPCVTPPVIDDGVEEIALRLDGPGRGTAV